MKWRIAALTFNVSGRGATRQTVETLSHESLDRLPDVDAFVLSLQEVRPVERADVTTADAWKELFHEVLWAHGFFCSASSFMLTNFLAFFVKTEQAVLVCALGWSNGCF